MLNFRVTNCLIDGKIVKCAIFKDGKEWGFHKRRVIEKTSEGKEYIRLPNKRMKTFLKTFTDRIGDAADEVINGDGDVIQHETFLGMKFIEVLYFLDREYGEEMKRKSIEGWKDTKFAWILRNSNFAQYVKEDGSLIYDRKLAKTFDTEEETLNKLDNLTKEAYSYIEKYKGREIDECFNDFIKDLNIYYNLRDDCNGSDLAVMELISKIVADGKYFEPKVEIDKFRPTSVFKPYQIVVE